MKNGNNNISKENISEQKSLIEINLMNLDKKKLLIEDISKREVTKAQPNKTGTKEEQAKEKFELQKKKENKTEIIDKNIKKGIQKKENIMELNQPKNIKKEIEKDSTNISQSFLNLLKYIDKNNKGNNPELIISNIRETIKEIYTKYLKEKDSFKKEKELLKIEKESFENEKLSIMNQLEECQNLQSKKKKKSLSRYESIKELNKINEKKYEKFEKDNADFLRKKEEFERELKKFEKEKKLFADKFPKEYEVIKEEIEKNNGNETEEKKSRKKKKKKKEEKLNENVEEKSCEKDKEDNGKNI